MIPANLLNTITTGDARELARALPDNSVDLVFTDPIYWQIEDYAWLAETAARVLRPGGSLLAFAGNVHAVTAGAAMLPHLTANPTLAHYVVGPTARLFSHSLQCNLIPLLWFSQGRPTTQWMAIQQSNPIDGGRGHNWGKNWRMIAYRMERMTRPGAVVFDPFAGGGTVPAVCKMLNRQYVAFEIDPATAERARARVEATQAMHPAFTAEQEVMPLEVAE